MKKLAFFSLTLMELLEPELDSFSSGRSLDWSHAVKKLSEAVNTPKEVIRKIVLIGRDDFKCYLSFNG